MRKIFVGMIAILASTMTLWAERVSEADAALIANNFMNVAPATTGSAQVAAPVKRMVRKAVNTTTAEPQYYLYENADGEGWVIIAANDAVTPVLAYSETGHFRTDNMPSNIRHWMGLYDRFITKIEADGVVASEEAKAEWDGLRKPVRKAKAATVVGPLIETKWDQGSPYNNLCPGTGSDKAYTGCVATAMAQIMNYWEWPVNGTGSHSYKPLDPNSTWGASSKRYTSTLSANFGNTTYDWANMRDKYTYISRFSGQYTEYATVTDDEKTAVATLMYHVGVACEMMYGNDDDGGSGTYTLNYGDWSDDQSIQSAIVKYFKYKKSGLTGYMRDGYTYGRTTYYEKWNDEDWTAMVKAELDKGRPILYGGGDEDGSGGHSFICDGYNSNDYFHFNWGWSGYNDGLFKLSSLTLGSGGAGGGSFEFSYNQDVLIGIEPDRPEGIEEIQYTEKATKVLQDGQVLILRGDDVYNLMGQKIK